MLVVRCRCWYWAEFRDSPTQDEFNAVKLKQAIKCESVKGFAWIPDPDAKRAWKIEGPTAHAVAVRKIGEWIANEARFLLPIVLVPYPGHATVSPGRHRFRGSPTRQRRSGRRPVPESGGCASLRGAAAVGPRAGREPPSESESSVPYESGETSRGAVLLVDDVLTTGGHMRAGARVLRDAGCEVVGGICVAHATHEAQRQPVRRS